MSVALLLPAFAGCDLGTYSQRSTEFLEQNPGGVKNPGSMKKEVTAIPVRGATFSTADTVV